MDDKLLPPLPEPADTAYIRGPQGGEYRTLSTSYEPDCAMFSPKQMQAYARAALAHAQTDAKPATTLGEIRDALNRTECAPTPCQNLPTAAELIAQDTRYESVSGNWQHGWNACREYVIANLGAQSDSAGDARDAARYRHIRAGMHCIYITPGPDEGNPCPAIAGSVADAAIDAAIAASAATKGAE